MRWVEVEYAKPIVLPGIEGYGISYCDWFIKGRNSGEDRFPDLVGKTNYAGNFLESAVLALWTTNPESEWNTNKFWGHHVKHSGIRIGNLWLNSEETKVYDPYLKITLSLSQLYDFFFGEEALVEFEQFLRTAQSWRFD